MELFDTHCHIQSVGGFEGEEATRELWARAKEVNPEGIIDRARQAGVTRLLCIGCDLEDSKLAVRFARDRENCWTSVGIHPHEAHKHLGKEEQKQFAVLAEKAKVVAIGECGLDYFYTHSNKSAQKEILKFQIELALEHNLPTIFHVREAFDDFWPIFEAYQSSARPIRGALHSFTDSQANLERAIKHGLYIGVNGIATFTKKAEQRDVYRNLPLQNLLLETDAPFLTPNPYRGKICEPYHTRTIAEFIAALRGETVEAVAKATTHNARQLFGVR